MIVDPDTSMAPTDNFTPPKPEQRRPPPPLPRPSPSQAERAAAGGFALLGCLAFVVAAMLSPYDAARQPLSHGTHRQLGLPPCAIQTLTGFPCPSCGMTTSVALVMHGDVVAASQTNWAGLIVAGLGLVATAWLVAIAAGIPPGGFTVDDTIKWLTVASASTALLRWLVLVGNSLPYP